MKIDKQELHSIFEKIKENRELYFNEFYEKYKDIVFAISYSIIKNSEDCEDIVQKVFLKLWNMENEKFPTENETGWLYTLTKNEALDFLKNNKLLLNIDDLYLITEENKELNDVIDKDRFNNIISKLNTQEQEIVSLKILSNLSFKEISDILNIPEGTVKWKYYKSIHTLKILLGNLGMFIVTFVIGLKMLLSSQKKESPITEETQKNETMSDSSSTSTEHQSSDDDNSHVENTIQDETNQVVYEENTNQVTVQEQSNIGNYYTIGMLSISGIFLIISIIFAIIFTKHQLNKKEKSSK